MIDALRILGELEADIVSIQKKDNGYAVTAKTETKISHASFDLVDMSQRFDPTGYVIRKLKG
jgi:hypothetical protein